MSRPPGSGGPANAQPGKGAEIRALNRHLVTARDERVLQVVAMVDALPQRGEADALIAPLRPRLAQLRPHRPLNLGRVLFTPLNAVIVPAAQWRRGSPVVPRTALPALIRQVESAKPALAAEVTAAMAGHSTADWRLLDRVGRALWPQAGAVLSSAPVPPEWEAETGLSAVDHAVVSRAAGLVLSRAVEIAEQAEADAPDRQAVAGMVRDAAAQGPEAIGVVVGVLLHASPALAALVLSVTTAHGTPIDAAGRAAAERAIDSVLAQIDAEQLVAADDPAGLAGLRRTVAMLDELATLSVDRPTRFARISEARGRIDAACRVRFESVLHSDVVPRLGQVPTASAEDEARLEAAARNLRGFEQVARRVIGSDHYDRLLRATSAALAPRPEDDKAARVARLRLAEILLGPEVALGMLGTIDAMAPG